MSSDGGGTNELATWLELPEVCETQASYDGKSKIKVVKNLPPSHPDTPVYFDVCLQVNNGKAWQRSTSGGADRPLDKAARDRLAAQWSRPPDDPALLDKSNELLDPAHRQVLRTAQLGLWDGELFLRTPLADLNSIYGRSGGAAVAGAFSFLSDDASQYRPVELGVRLATALLRAWAQRDSMNLLVLCFDKYERTQEADDASTLAPRQVAAERLAASQGLPGSLSMGRIEPEHHDPLLRLVLSHATQALLGTLGQPAADDRRLLGALSELGLAQAGLADRWNNRHCAITRTLDLFFDGPAGVRSGPVCLHAELATRALVWRVRSAASVPTLSDWWRQLQRERDISVAQPVPQALPDERQAKADADVRHSEMLRGLVLSEASATVVQSLSSFLFRFLQLFSASAAALPVVEIVTDSADELLPALVLALGSAPLSRGADVQLVPAGTSYEDMLRQEPWPLHELARQADIYLRHVWPQSASGRPGHVAPQRLWHLGRMASTALRHVGEPLYALGSAAQKQVADPSTDPTQMARLALVRDLCLKGPHDAAAVAGLGLLFATWYTWGQEATEPQETRAGMANLFEHWRRLQGGRTRLDVFDPSRHLIVMADLARGIVQPNDWNLLVFLLQRMQLASEVRGLAHACANLRVHFPHHTCLSRRADAAQLPGQSL